MVVIVNMMVRLGKILVIISGDIAIILGYGGDIRHSTEQGRYLGGGYRASICRRKKRIIVKIFIRKRGHISGSIKIQVGTY